MNREECDERVLGALKRAEHAIARLVVSPHRPWSSEERIGWEACRHAAMRELRRIERDFDDRV